MHNLSIYFGFLFFLIDCKTVDQGKKTDVPFGCWMHSREEDVNKQDVFKTYRNCDFSFPASRGRNGFILKQDGTIGLIGPSSTDGRDTTWGNWVQISKNELKLSFKETKISRISWQAPISKKLIANLH